MLRVEPPPAVSNFFVCSANHSSVTQSRRLSKKSLDSIRENDSNEKSSGDKRGGSRAPNLQRAAEEVEMSEKAGLASSGTGRESSISLSSSMDLTENRIREVAILGPGDSFGERTVMESCLRGSTVTCTTDCEFLTLDKWSYHLAVRQVNERALRKVRAAYAKSRLPNPPPHPVELIPSDEALSSPMRSSSLFNRFVFASTDVELEPPVMPMNDNESDDQWLQMRSIDHESMTPFYIEPDMSMEDRIHKASKLVEDAQYGRSMRAHRTGKWYKRLDNLYNSRKYAIWMFFVVLAHMMLVLWEPPSYRDFKAEKYEKRLFPLLAVEWGCVILYTFELLWLLWDLGPYWFFRSGARLLMSFVTVAMIADLAIFTFVIVPNDRTSEYLRVTRFLRPVLLLWRNQYIGRMYGIAVKILPRLVELIVIIFGLMTCYAVVGTYLFQDERQLYDQSAFINGEAPFQRCAEDGGCKDMGSFIFNGFRYGYSRAMLTLFVMLTRTNFPDIMYPPMTAEPLYAFYFFSFLLIGVFFLMQLVVAVVYDGYRDHQLFFLLADTKKEKETLSAAFHLLDVHDANVVTWDVFRLFMKKKFPNREEYQIRAIWKLMDTDGDQVLDESEFMEIVDAMFVEVSAQKGAIFISTESTSSMMAAPAFRYVSSFISSFAKSRFLLYLYILVVCVDSAALIALTQDKLFEQIDALCVAFFTLHILISVQGLGPTLFISKEWNVVNLLLTSLQIVGILATFEMSEDKGLDGLKVFRFFGLLRFTRVLAFIANLRIFTAVGSTFLASITSSLIRLLPVYVYMIFSLIAVVFYPFAIGGMELFNGDGDVAGEGRCSEPLFQNADVYARFCSFATSVRSLVQIFISTLWHEVMYDGMAQESDHTAWFFIAFYFVSVIVVMNLIVAVFLDLFNLERGQDDDESHTLSDLVNLNHSQKMKSGDGKDDSDDTDTAGVRSALMQSDSQFGMRHVDVFTRRSLAQMHRRLGHTYEMSVGNVIGQNGKNDFGATGFGKLVQDKGVWKGRDNARGKRLARAPSHLRSQSTSSR